MRNNNWQIVLKNSIDGSQFIQPIHAAFRTRLDVQERCLEIVEQEKPITLEGITHVIPVSAIRTVTLDNRYETELIPSTATSVKMTQTRGGRFEVELSSDPKIAEAQIKDFDNYVSWTK